MEDQSVADARIAQLVALVQWLANHVRYRWPDSLLPAMAEQRLKEIVK